MQDRTGHAHKRRSNSSVACVNVYSVREELKIFTFNSVHFNIYMKNVGKIHSSGFLSVSLKFTLHFSLLFVFII